MKISILGGNGTVGSGVVGMLNDVHDVSIFGRKDFKRENYLYSIERIVGSDVIIHSAGITDELVEEDVNEAIRMCTTFLFNLLDSVMGHGLKYFVYLSTIHVYGKLKESLNSATEAAPISPYAILHLLTERLLVERFKNSQVKLLILRIPTVYGFSSNGLVERRPKIIQNYFPSSVVKNGFIQLNSSGEQYRSFVSNFKVGQIIKYWLSKNLPNKLIITPVSGRNLRVIEFARLCIDQFEDFSNTTSKLKVPHLSSHIVAVATEIIPEFDCNECYPIESYLTDYYRKYFQI
jgi:UDP-glucose 4-epimerase